MYKRQRRRLIFCSIIDHPWPGSSFYVLWQDTSLRVPFLPQVQEWVLQYYSCNMLAYHPGGVEMLLLASQYWNWREEPTYSIEQSTSLKWRLICKPFVNTILFITVFQIIPKALEENMESKRKELIRSVQSVMSYEGFFLNRFMHLFDCVFIPQVCPWLQL